MLCASKGVERLPLPSAAQGGGAYHEIPAGGFLTSAQAPGFQLKYT